MENISSKSNAISFIVNSSKDLDSILYKLYNAILAPEGIPIVHKEESTRSIFIDKNVNEFILVLKKSPNSSIALTSPSDISVNLNEANKNILSINDYQFIKFTHPEAGEWILSGPVQELEQALILTTVSLVTNLNTGIYFNNELIKLQGSLEEKGLPIDSNAFLEQVINTVVFDNHEMSRTESIPCEGKGIFGKTITLSLKPGIYDAIWRSENKFLARERQYTLSVEATPFTYRIDSQCNLTLNLVNREQIMADSVRSHLINDKEKIELNQGENSEIWEKNIVFIKRKAAALNELSLSITAKTNYGCPVFFYFPISLDNCIDIEASKINHEDTIRLTQPLQSPPLKLKEQKISQAAHEVKKNNASLTSQTDWNNFIFVGIILLLIVLVFALILSAALNFRKKN